MSTKQIQKLIWLTHGWCYNGSVLISNHFHFLGFIGWYGVRCPIKSKKRLKFKINKLLLSTNKNVKILKSAAQQMHFNNIFPQLAASLNIKPYLVGSILSCVCVCVCVYVCVYACVRMCVQICVRVYAVYNHSKYFFLFFVLFVIIL